MDITQLNQELRSNKNRFCYLILGPERHLALSAQRQIVKAILKESGDAPDRFQAGETNLHKALDCLKTSSFLTPWRLVLVEEVDQLKKKDWEELGAFLSKPLSNATLILVADELSASELKKIPPVVAIVECKKLYPRQVTSWLNMEVRNLGLAISQEAAKFLADCVGTDLGELHQALQKLLLFVGQRKLIQLGDVEQVVANTAQKSVFELTNAIGEKKPQVAISFLENILEQGEEPLKALALISRHFRLLARAQELLAKSGGSAGGNFAKELKVHPFFAKDYATQAKRFKTSGWERRFEKLFGCDRALKSSRLKPQMVLEKLIWELCAD